MRDQRSQSGQGLDTDCGVPISVSFEKVRFLIETGSATKVDDVLYLVIEGNHFTFIVQEVEASVHLLLNDMEKEVASRYDVESSDSKSRLVRGHVQESCS
ncbi:hypothetical protein V6N13_108603 [Hibiscus sabdariffa]